MTINFTLDYDDLIAKSPKSHKIAKFTNFNTSSNFRPAARFPPFHFAPQSPHFVTQSELQSTNAPVILPIMVKQYHVRLSEVTAARLATYAAASKTRKADLIEQAVNDFLDIHEKQLLEQRRAELEAQLERVKSGNLYDLV